MNRRNRRPQSALFLVLCTLLVTAVLSSCAGNTGGGVTLLPPVSVSYDTALVTRGNVSSLSEYEAYVRAEIVDVGFEGSTGTLGAIHVAVGDAVKKGDLVAELDIATLEKPITTAKDNLDARRRKLEFDKTQKQLDIELAMIELDELTAIGSESDIEQKKTDISKLESDYSHLVQSGDIEIRYLTEQLRTLEKSLETARIYSPCDGEVIKISSVLPGQLVSSNVAIASVADHSNLYVQYDGMDSISAYDVYAVYNGNEYRLEPVEIDRQLYIELVLQGKKPPTMFTFKEGAKDIKAGDFVALYVYHSEVDNVLKLPSNALYYESGTNYVYLIEDGAKIYREVGCGLRTQAYVEITWGLEEGDEVFVKQ